MTKLGVFGGLFLAAVAFGGCGSEPESSATFTPLTPAPKQDGDPANGAVFATDVSFWETPISQAEMDCFWESGVRHVVVGTQQEDITRQQLAMAVSRGMTVDAYVYLYWDTNMTAQVKKAFQRVSGFPIGRMWLDIEEDPGNRGATAVNSAIAEAVTACQAQGGVECGIYTSPGFWETYTNDTHAFTDVPLWWAHYDKKTSLDTWADDAFGGWTDPVAKQWATQPLCGIGGVDWDTMQVDAKPTVEVDHAPPADTGSLPPAPTGLWPTDGTQWTANYAKVMSELVPLATLYDIAVERWSGSAWITYYKWSNPNAFVKFYPTQPNSLYRFRVRAKNTHGWGAWSDWSVFEQGSYAGKWPESSPPPEPEPDAGPPPEPDAGAPEPPPTGVPGSLSPDGGTLISTPSVTLTCSAVPNAQGYELAIEFATASNWSPYYTYAVSAPSRTFYPQIHGVDYRWRARAKVAGAFGAWSTWATFQFK